MQQGPGTAGGSAAEPVGSPMDAHCACSLPGTVSERLSTDCTSAPAQAEETPDDDALELQEHHASASSQHAAVMPGHQCPATAKPAHSVWSMSASSDSLSSHASPAKSDVMSAARPVASPDATEGILDGNLIQLHDSAQQLEGLSYSHVRIIPSESEFEPGVNRKSTTTACVTAELMGPAFDPEHFLMNCVLHDKLESHRLCDYAVQQGFTSDETDHAVAHHRQSKGMLYAPQSCSNSGLSHTLQCCGGRPWAAVVIVAVLEPRVTTNPKACSLVTVAAEVCATSGIHSLLCHCKHIQVHQALDQHHDFIHAASLVLCSSFVCFAPGCQHACFFDLTANMIWPCHMTLHHTDRDSHAAFHRYSRAVVHGVVGHRQTDVSDVAERHTYSQHIPMARLAETYHCHLSRA